MQFAVRIVGDAIMARRIQALVNVADSKSIRGALREGSRPIIDEARARAPSPNVARGIRFIRAVRKYGGAIVAEVGLLGGRRPWFYGLFVERGTGPRVQKTTGRSSGSMPARPFLRPAFDVRRREASRLFFESLKRRVMEARRG
jgi:HK97 gp10 family phage protein